MTITVHHLNNSRSQRILWLLEELGADYEIVHYQRDPVTNLAPPQLKASHPLGKSPLIEDDGLRVAESGAIIQYLCERHHGRDWLPPENSVEHVRHLEWMQFGESSFFVPVMLRIMAGRLGEAAAPILPRIDEQFGEHVAYMEEGINDLGHFVGSSWTAADVLMSFPAEIAVMQGFADRCHKTVRFVDAIHARPAWQRARERGGPYFVW